MESRKVILAYYPIRGLAQSIRNLCEYLKIAYEDKQYANREEWFGKDKLTFKSDFPNLPYLIDGDKYITESEAIIIYLIYKANRTDLLGETLEDKVTLTQLRSFWTDARKLVYDNAFKKEGDALAAIKTAVTPKLQQIAKFLGEKSFLNGKLSYVDFLVAENLNWLHLQDPEWLSTVGLKNYLDRFNNLEGIKEYRGSPREVKVFMPPEYCNASLKIALP